MVIKDARTNITVKHKKTQIDFLMRINQETEKPRNQETQGTGDGNVECSKK
jgi:hypothetical protein